MRTLIASGRDADVFDLGNGTVLRRYKRRDVPAHEVAAMRYAREKGYPVPRVVSVAGRDLVLQKIEGPTMQQALAADGSTLATNAKLLASLHHRLHEIAAPDGLPKRGDGDRLLHLDLHPGNVLLGPSGPVVIDWTNVARGPAALDPALAIAVFATAKAGVGTEERSKIEAFIRAFASHFDRGSLEAVMPIATELRRGDPNVTDAERRELEGYRL